MTEFCINDHMSMYMTTEHNDFSINVYITLIVCILLAFTKLRSTSTKLLVSLANLVRFVINRKGVTRNGIFAEEKKISNNLRWILFEYYKNMLIWNLFCDSKCGLLWVQSLWVQSLWQSHCIWSEKISFTWVIALCMYKTWV